jgi:hypothetical protein
VGSGSTEIVAAAMREGVYDPDVRVGLEVVPAALGADAGVIGAALAATSPPSPSPAPR